ncbi:MAG: trypsin-like serine protease [Myxococcota bacterium]
MTSFRLSRVAAPYLAALPLALGAVACQDASVGTSAPASPVAAVTAPIVNGHAESGYPGVGALTIRDGNRYYGMYCSGTLIAPNWVLTAGHCTAGSDLAQQGITPATVSFYLGNDSTPTNNGGLPAGKFYQSDAFVPMPDYDTRTNENDVGLVHLKDAVTDVEISTVNTSDLAAFLDAWQGQSAPNIITVGFGSVEGINESGSGPKRSTTITLDEVIPQSYVSKFVDTGTCFGDSGGPGFMEIDGQVRIVGVTSAGGNCPFNNPNCDPCTTETYSTRMDVYAAWINETISGAAPDCHNLPQMCLCADQCRDDGTCDDNVVCHIANCQDTYFCIRQCNGDAHCEGVCKDGATDEAKPLVDALLTCAADNCAGLTGQARRQCLQSKCADEFNTCFGVGPVTTGDQTCDQVYDCVSGCQSGGCYQQCLGQGTADAQTQVNALLTCLQGSCNDQQTEAGYTACAHLSCRDQVTTCFATPTGTFTCGAVDDCVIACPATDTECPSQCWELGSADGQQGYDELALCLADNCDGAGDAAACRAEKCASEDSACHPAPPPPKGEGEVCGAGDTCATGLTCTAHAGAASTCDAPVVACTDADHDGACVEVDCNDADASVHPGVAVDVCGNGVDDNCDGQIDEGCAPVVTPTKGGKDSGCAGAGSEASLVMVGLGLLVVARRRRVA